MNRTGERFSDVILSGGTGRSGTTIIGKLLSRHSEVGLSRPSEIKMLTSGNGLLDLHLRRRVGRYRRLIVNDRLHLARFKSRLFNDWWERDPKVGEIAGLIQGIELNELQAIYETLRIDWKKSRDIAPANFFRSFVDIQKEVSGKKMWIDTTPINLFRSKEIAAFLPGTRFIHMVRDGRDVIASVVRERWGPKNYEEGLVWYRRRMKRNLINSKWLDDRVLTISLENLVINQRLESFSRILEFLEIPNEKKIQAYFDSKVLPENVRRGRWRDEVEDVNRFNDRYFEIVAELKAIDATVPLSS
ncbi:MAG: hypothetical protein RLZZ12_857 [Actinomycetota bacterium]